MNTFSIRKQCVRHRGRKPCFICGEHVTITEAHHVLPLKQVARLLETWDVVNEPSIVRLCPNCHAV